MPDALTGSPRVLLREARAKIDEAWTLIVTAQEAMEAAGVPIEVRSPLDAVRLRLNDTHEITSVSNVLYWGGDHE